MVEKVLGKKVEPIKACAMMYKALFQAVLLYGSGIWVVTDAITTVIAGFYHRTANGLCG